MTSLFTPFQSSQLNIQPHGGLFSKTKPFNIIRTSTLLAQPFPSNKSDTSNSSKRSLGTTSLGDIIVKKIKTVDTSESTSTQGSPTTKRRPLFSNYDAMNWMEEEIPFKENMRIPAFDDVSVPVFSSNFMNENKQLQHALNVLKTKLLLRQGIELAKKKEVVVPTAHRKQEIFTIPPFHEFSVKEKEPEIKAKKSEKNEKKKVEKNGTEVEFHYGTVEFPFLSLSAPFLDIKDALTKIMENPVNIFNKVESPSSMKEEVEEENNAKNPQEAKRMETQEKKKINKMVVEEPKKETKKKAPLKVIKETKVLKVIEKMEEEVKEKPKSKGQDEENFYRRPFRSTKRSERRQKNKWQIAQDEKLISSGLPLPSIPDSWEIMIGGFKKNENLTCIGQEFQVDMENALKRSETQKRQPKLHWNPSIVTEKELQRFFTDLKKIVHCNFSQEKAVEFIAENEGDLKETLKYIRANKAKCMEKLKIKAHEESDEE